MALEGKKYHCEYLGRNSVLAVSKISSKIFNNYNGKDKKP